jgi:hypothetical protein
VIKENGAYVKLYRKFLNWGWFTDIPTCHLFIYLLIRAQYNEKEFRGVKVSAGELTTSLQIMSDESGLSLRQVRTALDKLEKTGELTRTSTNKFTHIKIVKWADYQGCNSCCDKQVDKQMTNERQTNDKQMTTIKESNKERNKERKNINNNKPTKHKYGEYQNVLLTDEEYNKLYQDFINAKELITYLDEYIEMKGYTAKSHYLAIKKWVVDAVTRENKKKEELAETNNPFLKMLMEEENGKTRNN